MRIMAAVDLRGGAAVQLVGGRPEVEPIRLADPAAVARHWVDAGFRHIHVVDLDAALGTGSNSPSIQAIARELDGAASLQVGGGIRGDDAVARALALGADRVVVGTRGVEDRPWLEAIAGAHGGRAVLAADVAGGVVLTRGWTRATGRDAVAFLRELDGLPLAGVLVTDVDREGRQAGIDVALFRRLRDATTHPLIVAGGVSSAVDLEELDRIGAAGAVLGMALYTGRIEPAEALALETT